jgi:hypothetical protein
MSFCCGASMIGTFGTMRHHYTYIQNVPLLYCPVCKRIKVHHQIEEEYGILADYAHGDGALEVDFNDYIDEAKLKDIFENCPNADVIEPDESLRLHIDQALDLLSLAKQMGDKDWEMALKKRLHVLSQRRQRRLAKKTSQRY